MAFEDKVFRANVKALAEALQPYLSDIGDVTVSGNIFTLPAQKAALTAYVVAKCIGVDVEFGDTTDYNSTDDKLKIAVANNKVTVDADDATKFLTTFTEAVTDNKDRTANLAKFIKVNTGLLKGQLQNNAVLGENNARTIFPTLAGGGGGGRRRGAAAAPSSARASRASSSSASAGGTGTQRRQQQPAASSPSSQSRRTTSAKSKSSATARGGGPTMPASSPQKKSMTGRKQTVPRTSRSSSSFAGSSKKI
jgi:hypothetical protein